MTPREYHDAFLHDRAPKPPNTDTGPLLPAWERWRTEGLRPDLDPHDYDTWCIAFGWDPWPKNIAFNPPREPLFQEEILEETAETITKRCADGSIRRDSQGHHRSIYHELRPAVTNHAEWDRLKAWLDLDAPLPTAATSWAQDAFNLARTSSGPITLHAGSMMGWVRNWVGFQEFAVLQYEDREWFTDMIETRCRMAEWQVRACGENGIPLNQVHFWEDICFKNGPIVSPAVFHEVVVPRYARFVELCAGYGYDRVSVDSDGNLDALLPGWVEAGIHILCPFEVQAGMDVNTVRRRYPGLFMYGGVHKYLLTQGEGAIRAELERVRPVVESGRYLPQLDHNVPGDVSFENYLTYCRLKRAVLGIGKPFDEARVRA